MSRCVQAGRGRALGNVYVERLWRTVKYDEVYLKSSPTCEAARRIPSARPSRYGLCGRGFSKTGSKSW